MVVIEEGYHRVFIGLFIYSYSRNIPSNSSSNCQTWHLWVHLSNWIRDPFVLRLGIDQEIFMKGMLFQEDNGVRVDAGVYIAPPYSHHQKMPICFPRWLQLSDILSI